MCQEYRGFRSIEAPSMFHAPAYYGDSNNSCSFGHKNKIRNDPRENAFL